MLNSTFSSFKNLTLRHKSFVRCLLHVCFNLRRGVGLVLILSVMGCAGEGLDISQIPGPEDNLDYLDTSLKTMQVRLLKLEWELAQCDGQANRAAMAPPVTAPKPVKIPSLNSLANPPLTRESTILWSQDSGSDVPIYAPFHHDVHSQSVAAAHTRAETLQIEYDALKAQIEALGGSIPQLPGCEECEGKGLKYGPHYDFGRKEDGELGLIFEMGGVHACRKCKGTGCDSEITKRIDSLSWDDLVFE